MCVRTKVSCIIPGHLEIYSRAEWKHTFLEIAKGPHGLWSTSQHWFQNNWRNHYRMNILLRNQENSFYRECKLQHSPISSNLFDEWDFCKHSHSQCCDAVQNHLESFKMLTLGLLGTHRGPKRVHLSYLAEINMRSLWCSGRVQMALKHFSYVKYIII